MQVKKWLLLVITGLVLIAGCGKNEKTVAVVGDAKITAADLERVVKRKLRISGRPEVSSAERQDILNQLVDRRLLYGEGRRLGLDPTKAELDAEIARLKGKFPDDTSFRTALKEDGLDETRFRKETEENLVVDKVESKLAAQVKPDQEEALRYYEGHKGDFAESPSYRVYLIQAAGREEAAQLLKKHSHDPAAFDRYALTQVAMELKALNMKAMLTPRENFPDEMQPFLAKMKIGEVGGPVKTRRGYFIFRLLDKRDGLQRTWDQAKSDVTHLLYQEKLRNVVRDWLSQQRSRVRIEMFTGRL